MEKSSAFIAKGEIIPLCHNKDICVCGEDVDSSIDTSRKESNCPWLLVPAWSAGGLFNQNQTRTRQRKDNGSRKRQRRDDNHNLEQLLAKDVRQCDVCARYIPWTPSLERQHFSSQEVSTPDDSFPKKSIVESLPKFVEQHLQCKSSLPCKFCVAAGGVGQWCGSLYCSEECRHLGESSLKSNTANDITDASASVQPTIQTKLTDILPPKLFFCHNRSSHGIEPEQLKLEETSELIREAADSLAVIENKFHSICGYDSNNGDIFAQTVGSEECALLLTTVISCTRPSLIREMAWFISNDKQTMPSVSQRIDSDEESYVEELWAMSRSHRSLCILLDKLNTANATDDTGTDTTFPSYPEFLQCYLDIKRHCVLRVDAPIHPLVLYATKTLISTNDLADEEMCIALDLLKCSWVCPQSTESKLDHETHHDRSNANSNPEEIQSAIHRWRYAAHFTHWISNPLSSEEAESTRLQPLLRRSFFVFSPSMFRHMSHSCAPTMALTTPDIRADDIQSPLDRLSWLALHDTPTGESTISKIDSMESDTKSRLAELKRMMGDQFVCSCIRCQYELLEESGDVKSSHQFSQKQLKRLADLAMQQGQFEKAASLYESILREHPSDGDVLHARAASHLGRASSITFADVGHCRGHFMEAQRLWKEAGMIKECATHPEIAVQVTKQCVYKTNQPEDTSSLLNGTSNIDNIPYTSHADGKCFLTSEETPILSHKECQHIINTAECYAAQRSKGGDESGWTTSRHYAVPTTDIALHDLTDLHSSFYQLWKTTIRPILRQQFVKTFSSSSSNQLDIFLHDVFVVRYDAAQQRYLPPHYDESTHSFILALNGDFKGGGTFIHSLNKTLVPSTGGMISFSGGDLLHSGDPVVEGIRYIIAAFCYIDLVSGYKLQSDDTRNRSSESKQQSKLTGMFADNGSKPGPVQENGQGFSFGFNV